MSCMTFFFLVWCQVCLLLLLLAKIMPFLFISGTVLGFINHHSGGER
jgi:hypothetical protein